MTRRIEPGVPTPTDDVLAAARDRVIYLTHGLTMPAVPSVVDEVNARWVTEDVAVALRERDDLIAELREQLAGMTLARAA